MYQLFPFKHVLERTNLSIQCIMNVAKQNSDEHNKMTNSARTLSAVLEKGKKLCS
jgi:hypothetical protein